MKPTLILASTSPRRMQLLEQVNIPFKTRKSNANESNIQITNPFEKVTQLAKLKGNMVEQGENEVILAADTVVSYEDVIFEKPKNIAQARLMIQTLNGQTHDVFTGVYIKGWKTTKQFVEKTSVTFWELTNEEIEAYIQTNDPYDKAGAYGIQSTGATLVKHIFGDYYNVVGLPISKVARELRTFHIKPN